MTLTPEQVQAQTAAIRSRSGGDSRVVALRHIGGWSGPNTLKVSGEDYLVIPCISDLQIREALGQLEEKNSAGILLCDVDQATLGEDVLARLVRRQIHHPKKDEMLRELFAARVVDARILSSRPLVEALICGASAGGYSPAPGGTLDLQFAWQGLLKQKLGFEVTEISFPELLRWTTIPSGRNALKEMATDLRGELARWLEPNYGKAPSQLFRALDSELGSDLLALGLLLGLLLDAEKGGVADAHAAAARLEQYFGNEPLDASPRQAWHQASASLFEKLAETEVFQAQGVIQNLDRLIERIRLKPYAHLSNHSLVGLEQRLTTAGEAIGKAGETLSEAQISIARTALDGAAQHRLAADHGIRLRRLQMGLRLVLWLRINNLPETAATLSQLISYYSTEGGFIDWARTSVVESDPNPQIKEALRSIIEKVEVRWDAFQEKFTERLQQWSAQGADLQDVLRIEEVLGSVVAPVARQQPALLIVLDGMSQAVFRELVSDLMRRNWVQVAAPATDTPRAVLAAIPSVTEVSRRALLSGQLPLPTQGSEKTDFAGSDQLLEQVGGQTRPQLFLKGDLLDSGRMGLAAPVLQALANSRCRLVGVVVNAVDDSLSSADQMGYSWKLDQIYPLQDLMRMASESGRVVILTSDHGHVLDEGSQMVRQPLPETGDRYRLPGGTLSEGEMEFCGARVQAATGSERVVELAALRRRYQGKRRGYHGGVCPAEMVVPCVVLRSSNTDVPDTWEDLPPYEPEWWSLRAGISQVATIESVKSSTTRRPFAQKQADLFHQPVEVSGGASAWIEQLLGSATYQQQARAAVRGAPSVEQFKRFLMLLDQRNGRIQRGYLAQQLTMPLIRVDGLIQNYRRLLNVDGYDVLSYDQPSETIVLNLELLKSQFEL
jgi:hypothetical protein